VVRGAADFHPVACLQSLPHLAVQGVGAGHSAG
jgi:hypothetical protein